MAIKCNNCGAPIAAPPPDAHFAACSYCGTAVALPARRTAVRREAAPTGSVPARGSGGASSFRHLPLVIGIVAGGGVLVAVTVKNLSSEAPAAEASAAAPREPNVVAVVPAPEVNAPNVVNPSAPEESTRKDVRREPRGGGTTPKPGASVAPKPTTPAAPTAPAPSPTPTPTPAPTPEAPSTPKVAKASIGSITVARRSLSEVQPKVLALRGPIRDCYQKHLAERPNETGTLEMRFSIDSEGVVRGAGARNPFFTGNLVSCVNRTFYTMSFPPSEFDVVEVKLVVTLTSSP